MRAGDSSAPRVTVIVPVRDEERDVARALTSLARQTIGPESIEVLVYDGGSIDRTADVCRELATRYAWGAYDVLENAERTVPYALNAGVAKSRSEWVTVISGRTEFSPNYLEACLAQLDGSEPSVAAGGRFVARANGGVARAIAAVVTHPFGVGKGFRTATRAGDVPHHPFAVWRRDDVLRLGGFDTELTRNQDDEFCMRAVRQGARIRLVPEASVTYRPRERYQGLAVQYFQYGLWKSAVALRTGLFPKRSAVPAVVVGGLSVSVALALTGRTRTPLAAFLGLYAVGGTIVAVRAHCDPLLTGLALGIVHLSYGSGVIAGAARPGLVASSLARTRRR